MGMADTQELLLQAQSLQDGGDYYSLRRIAARLVDAATADSDQRAIGRGLTFLGVAEMRVGDPADARAAFERAIEYFELAGHTNGIVGAKTSLGTLALDVYADAREARRMYDEALQLVRDGGNPVACGIALVNMAEVCRMDGDLTASLQFGQEALEQFAAGGAAWRRALALVTVAHVRSLQGATGDAIDAMEEARRDVLDSSNAASLAFYYEVYAIVAVDCRAVEAAALVFGFVNAVREHYGLTEERGLAPWRAAAAKRIADAVTPQAFDDLRRRGAALGVDEIHARLADALAPLR